jgi:hypothetical protein
VIDLDMMTDAVEYWESALGIRLRVIESDVPPRVLVRTGTDGLGSADARGGVDGTDPTDNRAVSAIIVVAPGGGRSCAASIRSCRILYRHELGHALGFFGHTETGLMRGDSEVLSERERRMMITLYSLPHGARVGPDGSWEVAASGASGRIEDLETARDIMTHNMHAVGGASYRNQDMICRWEPPVSVFVSR